MAAPFASASCKQKQTVKKISCFFLLILLEKKNCLDETFGSAFEVTN